MGMLRGHWLFGPNVLHSNVFELLAYLRKVPLGITDLLGPSPGLRVVLGVPTVGH